MTRPSSPPPFPPSHAGEEGTPPKREKGPILRVKEGLRPGSEIFELEMGTEPPPPTRRLSAEESKAAAGRGAPTVPVRPQRASDPRAISTLPPPRKHTMAFEADDAASFKLAMPGPAGGGDTDLDPIDDGPVDTRLKPHETGRRSFEFALDLDLGLGDQDDPLAEALDLVGRSEGSSESISVPPGPTANPVSELREKYALGDFSGALVIAEQLLKTDPANNDAQRYAESCRDVLKQMYAARLGPLDQVPVVAVGGEQLRWLTLDHRAGFLLSHVDGVSTLEEILDVSGMPTLDAMRIIVELVAQKVIVLQ